MTFRRSLVFCAPFLLCVALAFAGCAPVEPELEAAEESIVGGTVESGFPSVVFLYNSSGGACTATVISPRVVLTARHCVVRGEGGPVAAASALRLYVGGSLRSFVDEYRVRTVFVIPGSSGGIGDGRAQDLALLELTAPARVEPMEIARTSGGRLIGQDITAIGFGQIPTGSSGTKYRVSAAVQGYQQGLIFVEPAVCQGDSGGPVIGADGLIYGVASFIFSPDGRTEPRCGTAPGAYNEIFRHLDWIDGVLEVVGDACIPDAEICNGLDDDCNGMVDEGCLAIGSPCDASERCVGGLCAETVAGVICTQECDPLRPTLGCGPGFYCASEGCSGHCVPGEAGTFGINFVCDSDTQCASLYCRDPGDGRRRCLATCRAGEGLCLAGEVCVAGEGLCGPCVPDSIVDRAVPRGVGEPCGEDSHCGSGVCADFAGVRECASACGADSDCSTGFVCRDALCRRDPRQGIGGVCERNEDCGDGVCASRGSRSWCTAPCGGPGDCPAGFECTEVAPGASVCAPSLGLPGDSCSTSEECTTGLCAGVGGGSSRCVAFCDSERHCGAGFECRRTADGMSSVCLRPGGGSSGGCAVSHGRPSALVLPLLSLLGLVLLGRWRRRRA